MKGKKKKKKKKKKNLSREWGTDRKIRPSGSQSDITRQASWCQTVTLENRIYHGYDGQIEKPVPRDHSLTSLDKPRDARK